MDEGKRNLFSRSSGSQTSETQQSPSTCCLCERILPQLLKTVWVRRCIPPRLCSMPAFHLSQSICPPGCLLLHRLPLVRGGHLKSLKDSPVQTLGSFGIILFVVVLVGLFIFYFVYMDVLPVGMAVHHVCEVPVGVRKGCHLLGLKLQVVRHHGNWLSLPFCKAELVGWWR